ncbi:MAG: hypothetical protein U0X73_00950 [Thermoanaerobaculia bacterium]
MRKLAAGVAGVLAVGLALALAVARLERAPQGAVEPVWDHDACAHCGMHVSDRRFAAEVQTEDGRTLFFDDPGCLLAWRETAPEPARAVYFHALDGERWLAESEVEFVATRPTPMDWGLGAVPARTPGAMPLAAARRRIAERGAAEAAGEEGAHASQPR